MNPELKDILSHLNKDVDQEKLLQYLNRSLTAAEQHELEMQLNDDTFLSDAMDGLEQIDQSEKLPMVVQQLNAGLKIKLDQKKKIRRRTDRFKYNFTYYSIIILLLLTVIAFVVIRKFLIP
ncbi:MAG: hypothetical protein WD135_03595 [Ferruginibacter sp.]